MRYVSSLLKKSLIAAVMAAAPSVGWSACAGTTMGGTWQFFYAIGDGSGGSEECTVSLAGNGTILTGGVCKNRSIIGVSSKSISGGFTVTAGCTVTGGWIFPNGATITLDAARLDASRNVLHGVVHTAWPEFGTMTMVRY